MFPDGFTYGFMLGGFVIGTLSWLWGRCGRWGVCRYYYWLSMILILTWPVTCVAVKVVRGSVD